MELNLLAFLQLFQCGPHACKSEHLAVVADVFFDSAPVRRIEYTGSLGNVTLPKMSAAGPTVGGILQLGIVQLHELASFLKLQDPVITVEIVSAA
mmetsp:Transcript_143360/g.458202  ORF Transcript_143360/g.458202 Transcript_143360/m.458202 type:complete len:95 (-) Transcript_143360:71-355(-)